MNCWEGCNVTPHLLLSLGNPSGGWTSDDIWNYDALEHGISSALRWWLCLAQFDYESYESDMGHAMNIGPSATLGGILME